MTPAEKFIERLQVCRPSGKGKWIAQCPAHDDRSPSLSIKEAEDGRLLIKCFAGCEAGDVIRATGLEIGDLFPDDMREDYSRRANKAVKSEKRGFCEAYVQIMSNERKQGIRHTRGQNAKEIECLKYLGERR